ncbi:Imm21 family immunity protein [Streptomyces sp. SID8380]|uniref:Imm21 family immunity protein n=1 Tax=Streptomyces sp. SID8380 TaxID=2690360 RepID=UPI00359C7411
MRGTRTGPVWGAALSGPPVVVPLSAVNGWGGCSGKARSAGAEGRDDYDHAREVEGWGGAGAIGTSTATALVLVLADEPARTCPCWRGCSSCGDRDGHGGGGVRGGGAGPTDPGSAGWLGRSRRMSKTSCGRRSIDCCRRSRVARATPCVAASRSTGVPGHCVRAAHRDHLVTLATGARFQLGRDALMPPAQVGRGWRLAQPHESDLVGLLPSCS